MNDTVYEPRSIKRRRSTKAEVERLSSHIISIAEQERPLTLRQLYYRLVAAGVIAKSKNEYQKVGYRTKLLRTSGWLPWAWLVDNVRSSCSENRDSGPQGALARAAKFYRRDLMMSQPVAVQVWAESDSVASIVAPIALDYGIDVAVERGYTSRGYLWSCATDVVNAWVDPTKIRFERVAVTLEQVAQYGLEPRETNSEDQAGSGMDGCRYRRGRSPAHC